MFCGPPSLNWSIWEAGFVSLTEALDLSDAGLTSHGEPSFAEFEGGILGNEWAGR
jgi:hypothetical protein